MALTLPRHSRNSGKHPVAVLDSAAPPPPKKSWIDRARGISAIPPAIAIIALIAALRLPNVFYAGMDWNEATYSLVARDILWGRLPYTGAFDHKPMGLYETFAAFLAVFGSDPFAVHILGIVAVSIAAVTFHHILSKRFGLDRPTALILSLAYAFACGGIGGSSINTEILITAPTMLWLSLLLKNPAKPGVLTLLAIGGLMGFAFELNYLAGFLIIGFVAGYAVLAFAVEKTLVGRLGFFVVNGAIVLVGFAIVNLLVLSPLIAAGLVTSYFEKQIQYLSGYKSDISNLRDTMLQLERSLPYLATPIVVGVTGIAMAVSRKRAPRPVSDVAMIPIAILILAVLAGALAAAMTSGRYYPTYFVLMIPATFLLTALVIARVFVAPQTRQLSLGVIVGASLLMGAPGIIFALRGAPSAVQIVTGKLPTKDPYRLLAHQIQPLLRPGDTIYVACEQHVLYMLLNVEPPTQYPYYMHHLEPIMSAALHIVPAEEIDRIIARRPRAVVLGDFKNCVEVPQATYDMIGEKFKRAGYQPYQRYDGGEIYLSGDPPRPADSVAPEKVLAGVGG